MCKVRLVVGISGASGIKLAIRLIEELYNRNIEVHTVVTDNALKVAKCEVNKNLMNMVRKYSKGLYRQDEMDAPISSGSYPVDGMVIIPCSMNTVAKLSYGITDNLLLRAADVQIKMKNKLVIVPREIPVSRGHLRNLLRLASLESVYIMFPVLTYYHKPKTLRDMENFIIGRILDVFGIEHDLYKRWGVIEE
mgnify:CR=1 FL=1